MTLKPFVVGNFCYGGNQYAAEIFREDLHFQGIELKLCHEYPNADFPYDPQTIYDFIDSCDAIILPGRTKLQACKSVNRLALAWSRKKAVVIPPLASYLKYAIHETNCLIAHSPQQGIDSVIRLRDDEDIRTYVGNNGYSVAITKLNPRTQVDKLLASLRELKLSNPWTPETFVQIIIPHYADRLDYLTLAVKAAVETKGPPRNIMVVTSSKQNPTEALSKYENVRVYFSKNRLSFSEANNVGIKFAHTNTTHFLLLNDDTIMGQEALGRYFEVMGDKNIILNPYSNCDKGWLHNDQLTTKTHKQLVPNMALEDFTPQDLGSLLAFEGYRDPSIHEAEFCAFYATLIPKGIVDRVGLLNRRFLNGSEDLDYCKRAQQLLGAKCYWTRNAFVFHFGGKTRKFAEDENHAKHHAEDRYNQTIIAKRWPTGKKRVGIWAGPGWGYWDLTSYRKGGEGLGGSETCAGRLAEICAAQGHYVTLYGQFSDVSEQFGVELIPYDKAHLEEEFFDTFIALRNLAPINETLKARRKLVWVHDIWLLSGQTISDYHKTVVDKFIALSPWHLNFAAGHHGLPHHNFEIIPNGVNVEIFPEFDPDKKVPGKFLWCSSPDRGLDHFLYCLPFIQQTAPEAHLDITYGFTTWESMSKARNDQDQLRIIGEYKDAIARTPGVNLIGRVSQPDLAKIWAETYIWGYPTEFSETYCLSAKEAQVSGTPIVTTNVGALESTVGDFGHRINHSARTREGRVEFVQKCLELLTDKDKWVQASARSLEGAKGISWGDRYNDYWRKWIEG